MGEENLLPTQRERMLAEQEYRSDDPELRAASQRARSLAHRYNQLEPLNPEAALPLLRELLGGLGTDSQIRAPLQVDYGFNLTLGANCFINFSLVALDVAAIRIGNDVSLRPT